LHSAAPYTQRASIRLVERLPDGVVRVRAANPSPMTLDGTNSYVVAGWVVDPGPDDEAHLHAILDAAGGDVTGIVLTHDHLDHAAGAARLAALAGGVPVRHPGAGDDAGPFEVVPSPGHSADSVCLIHERVCFSGDTVLGEGSVFVPAGGGGLVRYLAALERLLELELDVICPGHGPVVWDPHERIEHYIRHRLEREQKVLAAIEAGARTNEEILERAWDDAPIEIPVLRAAASTTLEAHLDKLRDEGRLPG
jgi:glyoxylase-like metal-dependent hydrolase (beta-lactamase superfamily II)